MFELAQATIASIQASGYGNIRMQTDNCHFRIGDILEPKNFRTLLVLGIQDNGDGTIDVVVGNGHK